MSGRFEFSATFGTGQPKQVELSSGVVLSSFFSSYEPAGNLRWVKTTQGPGKMIGIGLAADAADNLYLVGQYLGRIVLGALDRNETALDTPTGAYPGLDDLFVAKFLPSGELVWAISEEGAQEIDNALSVAIDPLLGVYVTGQINGTVTFGAGEPSQTTFKRSGRTLYLAHYDSGNFQSGDTDNDSVPDTADHCPRRASPDQADLDADGFGDACVPPGSVDASARIGADALLGAGSRVGRDALLGDRRPSPTRSSAPAR